MLSYELTGECDAERRILMIRNGLKYIMLTISILLIGNIADAFDNGDFQIWNTNAQEVKIGKSTKFKMEEEFRYGNGGGDIFYQHYEWGFGWAFDKTLGIDLGYRLVLEKPKNKWMESDEPYVNITPKFSLWKLQFEDRNRIEYRHFRFADDHMRYRNKLAIKYPFEFKKIEIAPYVAEEIFVVSNGRGFNQNRLEQGLEFGLTKYAKMHIAYMHQSMRGKGNKWSKANILWLKARIMF